MDYEKIDMGSYNLHFINTDKFKTNTISVNFREKVKKEEITIRKVLFQTLYYTTKKYNTNRLFQLKLEDLYSMSIGHSNLKFGNLINSYIDIKFLNEKYTDDKFIFECIDFLFEILFNPNVENEKFDSKSLNFIKEKIGLSIDSKKENPEIYALNKSLETLENDPISYSLWGYKEDLEKINEKCLYEYYKKILKTNKIDIFIIGTFDKEKIKNYLSEKFIVNTIKMDKTNPYVIYDKCDKVKEITNNIPNLKQSKLSIVCKILDLTEFERRYVLPIYASILGGSSNSRLFLDVREKKSLAYSIQTLTKGPNSILIISAGISANKYNEVIKIINNDIKGMKKGITDDEINSVRNELISSIETLLDSPSGIINYYFGIEFFNSETIDKKIENYNKVTKKDIQNFANKVKMSVIYLLEGSVYEEK